VNRDMDPGINLAGEVQGYKCRSIRRASPEFEEASTYYYANNINLPGVYKRHSRTVTVFLYDESLNCGTYRSVMSRDWASHCVASTPLYTKQTAYYHRDCSPILNDL
jgi:hypothetical protein